jgi:predicted small metal-binding protein
MSYDLRCRDAGAVSCRGHVRGDDEEEFKVTLLAHLRDKHGVERPNDTLVDYLMSVASGKDRKSVQV